MTGANDPATRLADLRAASKTIGSTLTERLAWIVGFIQEDPETWQSTRRAEHGNCLLALARGGYIEVEPDADSPPPPPLRPGEVDALHRDLNAMLRAVVGVAPGEGVKIPAEGLSVRLVRATPVGLKPAIFGLAYGDPPTERERRASLFHAVKDLILRAGDRLLACPVCKRPFLAGGRRKYCSRECTNRATWANYPEKKKGKARKKWYRKQGWTYGARKKGQKNAKKKA